MFWDGEHATQNFKVLLIKSSLLKCQSFQPKQLSSLACLVGFPAFQPSLDNLKDSISKACDKGICFQIAPKDGG